MMLGHVASSVGSALPNSGLSVHVLGQAFVIDPSIATVSVPLDAFFVFAEVVGQGGYAINASPSAVGGGGAGNDGIFAVTPGEALSIRASNATTPAASTVSRGSTVLLSADAGGNGTEAGMRGPGAAGKYPGSTSGSTSAGGKAGGRLGGPGAVANGSINNSPRAAGIGGGGAGSSAIPCAGGTGCVCLTFFASYDAALAFAKSVYGGSWSS